MNESLEVIYLAAPQPPLAKAFKAACRHFPMVEVFEGSILDLEVDAVVSPANSFGFMDGGLDMAYSRYFGWDVQERLQDKIAEFHHGELLVGAAEIVPTTNDEIPWVIAAPTMRVPMILDETVNPYLAARAVFLLQAHGTLREPKMKETPVREVVSSIAFPGMGTGVGNVSPEVCARQIAAAIQRFVMDEEPWFPESWADAQLDHQRLYGGSGRDLQIGS